MLRVFVAVTVLGLAGAMVCLPEMCAQAKQPLLNCRGGVQKGGGFCGCTDVCAKMEGETCQTTTMAMFGVPPGPRCDEGLSCQPSADRSFGLGTCVKSRPARQLVGPATDAQGHKRTKCEQMKLSSMISMVVYEGQWFAKCDAEGNFMPQQCDNTGHCFCVDKLMGVKQEGTYVLGAAQC